MKNTKRALAVLLALVMTFALSVGAMADYEVKAEKKTAADIAANLSGKTVILHSNDVHGALEGYAAIAALKTALKAKGAEVILADAGDFSQGTRYVSVSKGATAVEMMNAAGYDIATLGSHEFDYGYAQLKENLSKAKFKTVCCNVLENDKTICDAAYIYKTQADVKIAFIGITTPETQTKVNPSQIQGIKFLSNANGKTEFYDCVQNQVYAVEKDADIVIALAHLGVDDASATAGYRSADLLAKVSGIDFVIDGCSHTAMTEGEKGALIQSTGTKFENIGVIVIDNATKKIESHFLITTEGLEKDATVAAVAKKIMDEVDKNDPLDQFNDLNKTQWYAEGIRFCLDNGLMNGMGEGKFEPNGTTTRAQLVAMLYRYVGSPKVENAPQFSDVAAGKWYTDAIGWAAANKVVNGVGDGKFDPNGTLTREQIAAILYRYVQQQGKGFVGSWMFLLNYPDADKVSGYADEAMHWMVMNQLINGVDGKLLPQGNATRAQVAVILMRFDAALAK